jgi:acetyl-CoA carboxylase carboxyl transferase subunit alpha
MKISAHELLATNVIDELVPEPEGGAHLDHSLAATYLKEAILKHLNELKKLPLEKLLEQRYRKYRTIGTFSLSDGTQ